MRNLTTLQAAKKCGVHHGTMCRWLKEGRVSGAYRTGRNWIVPHDFKIILPYTPATIKRAVGQQRAAA